MTRIFFTTDIHGSEICFRKFLNAGKFYQADVLILGGDITGKVMIPLVRQTNGNFSAHLMGADETAASASELQALEKRIRDAGYYPYRTEPDEMGILRQNAERVNQILERLMRQTLSDWLQLAEDRLKPQNIPCFISPGNDDPYAIDAVLAQANWVQNPEGRVVQLDDDHEMISCGYSNLTPWSCPRDTDEESLAEKIAQMTSQVRNPANCIFNLHCPPYNTLIDAAPRLDENLHLVASIDGSEMVSVGSTAVRAAIEKTQPLLGLHGHVHEGRGKDRLGRTTVVNPGSEYGEGILRGALIDISRGRLKSLTLTSG